MNAFSDFEFNLVDWYPKMGGYLEIYREPRKK